MEESMSNQTQSMPVNRLKFIVAGLFIFAALVYLIVSSTQAGAQYFLTVDELLERGASIFNKDVRISGAVLGDTIHYNNQTFTLSFDIAHVPGDSDEIEAQGGLASVLHAAVNDPNRKTLHIIYKGVQPDLLRHEAQAILSGHLGEDGIFYADELLLKCPSKYEEALPDQAEG